MKSLNEERQVHYWPFADVRKCVANVRLSVTAHSPAAGWPAFNLGQLIDTLRFLLVIRPVGKFDGQAFGIFRRHLRHDLRHFPWIDLGGNFHEDSQVEPVENTRSIL